MRKILTFTCTVTFFIVLSLFHQYQHVLLLHPWTKERPTVQKIILAVGPNISSVRRNKKSLLTQALIKRRRDVVDLLIEKGVDVNTLDRLGKNALMNAIIMNRKEIALLLIMNGTHLEHADYSRTTALHLAVHMKRELIVNELLKHKVKVHTVDRNGDTPLTMAARNGDAKMIELLVKHGAQVNFEQNDEERTVLMEAASLNRLEAVKVLLKTGANPNLEDRYGFTALSLAIANRHLRVVQFLIPVTSKEVIMSKAKYSPLHLAGESGQSQILKLLRQKLKER